MDKKGAQLALQHRILEAMYAWELDLFGEELNEKNKWGLGSGRDAISLYLATKHGWTIGHCQSLSCGLLRIALADEMKSWKRPSYLDELFDPFLAVVKQSRAA